MTRITDIFTAIDWVEVTDPELLRQQEARKPETNGQPLFRSERKFLASADSYRDELFM